MSATVFGDSRYGITADATATGLVLNNLQYSYSVEEATAADHTGTEFAMALYNDKTEITADRTVATQTAGITLKLADALTLANDTADSLNVLQQNLFTTADSNASSIITALDITRSNREFETGSLTAKYCPLIPTDSPTVISS